MGSAAMRLNSVWPSARYCITCSRDILRISKRSAPALKDLVLADAKITPAGRSRSMASSACARSASIWGEQVFTGLPGRSSNTVTMFWSSLMLRTVSIFLPPLQQHGRALPAADAQRGDAEIEVAALHLQQRRQHEPRAGGADR